MNKSLIVCDKVLYGSLLCLALVLPYSLMLLSTFEGITAFVWMLNGILLAVAGHRLKFHPTASSMAWPLIAIGLLIALTIPLSHYPAVSFKKLGTRFIYQIALMGIVMHVINSRLRLRVLLGVILFTVLLVSVDALLQYVQGSDSFHHTMLLFGRVSGPMHHPNDLGTLLVTILPLALASIFIMPGKWTRLLSVVLFLVLAAALGLTFSRGAWIAFAVSMIVLGLCLRNRKIILLIVLMLTAFFLIFGLYCLGARTDLDGSSQETATVSSNPPNHDAGKQPVMSSGTTHGSVQGLVTFFSNSSDRELYWKTAIDVIRHYPWFGCGYGAYMQTLQYLNVGHTEYPHNSLLHITAELGLVGLLLHGWLLTAFGLKIRKILQDVGRQREFFLLGCGISCGILAWMVHSLLDTPWSSLQLSFLLWLMIGTLFSLRSDLK